MRCVGLMLAAAVSLFAVASGRPQLCEEPPPWSHGDVDIMGRHRGNVTVVTLLLASWQLCLWQAQRFSGLLASFEAAGMSNIQPLIVNHKHPKSKQLAGKLKENAGKIPVYQDDDGSDIWRTLEGDKDDFYVYDRCGRLAYYLPNPTSLLYRPYVLAAILSTYYDEPCGPCPSASVPDAVIRRANCTLQTFLVDPKNCTKNGQHPGNGSASGSGTGNGTAADFRLKNKTAEKFRLSNTTAAESRLRNGTAEDSHVRNGTAEVSLASNRTAANHVRNGTAEDSHVRNGTAEVSLASNMTAANHVRNGTAEDSQVRNRTVVNPHVRHGTAATSRIRNVTAEDSHVRNGTVAISRVRNVTAEDTHVRNGTVAISHVRNVTAEDSHVRNGTPEDSSVRNGTVTISRERNGTAEDSHVTNIAAVETSRNSSTSATFPKQKPTNGSVDATTGHPRHRSQIPEHPGEHANRTRHLQIPVSGSATAGSAVGNSTVHGRPDKAAGSKTSTETVHPPWHENHVGNSEHRHRHHHGENSTRHFPKSSGNKSLDMNTSSIDPNRQRPAAGKDFPRNSTVGAEAIELRQRNGTLLPTNATVRLSAATVPAVKATSSNVNNTASNITSGYPIPARIDDKILKTSKEYYDKYHPNYEKALQHALLNWLHKPIPSAGNTTQPLSPAPGNATRNRAAPSTTTQTPATAETMPISVWRSRHRQPHDHVSHDREREEVAWSQFDLSDCGHWAWRRQFRLAKECCRLEHANRPEKSKGASKCERMTNEKCKKINLKEICCRTRQEVEEPPGQETDGGQDPEEAVARCEEFTPYLCAIAENLGIRNATACCAERNLSDEERRELCGKEPATECHASMAIGILCGNLWQQPHENSVAPAARVPWRRPRLLWQRPVTPWTNGGSEPLWDAGGRNALANWKLPWETDWKNNDRSEWNASQGWFPSKGWQRNRW